MVPVQDIQPGNAQLWSSSAMLLNEFPKMRTRGALSFIDLPPLLFHPCNPDLVSAPDSPAPESCVIQISVVDS